MNSAFYVPQHELVCEFKAMSGEKFNWQKTNQGWSRRQIYNYWLNYKFWVNKLLFGKDIVYDQI